jgi:hemolysin activation/secretion protein
VRISRTTDAMSFNASFSWNGSFGGRSTRELAKLGRPTDIDDDWQILRFDASLSAFLEPVLARVFGAVDPGARVNEIFVSFRGQDALNNRLIPQETMIAGGLYTVRGYPQATLAGDSVYLSRAEYRLHVPRLFPVQPRAVEVPILGEFRVARQHARGRPDWDLVLSAFTDVGTVRQSKKVAGEISDTLWGIGLGAELRIRRNLSVTYNFGVAMSDVDETGTGHRAERGDAEHHLSFTVLY